MIKKQISPIEVVVEDLDSGCLYPSGGFFCDGDKYRGVRLPNHVT